MSRFRVTSVDDEMDPSLDLYLQVRSRHASANPKELSCATYAIVGK